jgi:hypothetical protein
MPADLEVGGFLGGVGKRIPDAGVPLVLRLGHGTPRDGSDAFKRIVQAQKHPHDILHQFRINAIGYDGTEWSGGWTTLTFGEEAVAPWAGRISRLCRLLSHAHARWFRCAEKTPGGAAS